MSLDYCSRGTLSEPHIFWNIPSTVCAFLSGESFSITLQRLVVHGHGNKTNVRITCKPLWDPKIINHCAHPHMHMDEKINNANFAYRKEMGIKLETYLKRSNTPKDPSVKTINQTPSSRNMMMVGLKLSQFASTFIFLLSCSRI